MAIEFSERLRRIPVYPAADPAPAAGPGGRQKGPVAMGSPGPPRPTPSPPGGAPTAPPGGVGMRPPKGPPAPPLPAVVEAVTRVLGTLNRYPDPSNSRLR